MERRAAIVLGVLLACCHCALALNPSLDINQYAHTAWTVREGFFKGTITSIAQMPDGYLWLGTEFGLLRFDTGLGTILNALERPEVVASVPDQDPLAMARLRGIEAKRRLLTEDGRMLSAERAGEILTMSRQAVEKRRKAGRLIGVSLGRRGFGYPAWQFTERGTLQHLDAVLDVLKGTRRLDEARVLDDSERGAQRHEAYRCASHRGCRRGPGSSSHVWRRGAL